jgi:diadenylate cyclase
MSELAKYLSPQRIVALKSRNKDSALRELVRALARSEPRLKEDGVLLAVQERERIVSSWIGPGIAVPHARVSGLAGCVVAVGRSHRGIIFDSSDGNPVYILILIVSDAEDPDGHIALLAEIARTLRDLALVQLIKTARSAAEVHRLLTTHGDAARKPSVSAKLRLSRLLFAHALAVAEEVKAKAILLHGDAVGDLHFIEDIPTEQKIILITADKARYKDGRNPLPQILQVPFPNLNRANQVEIALLFALSRGLIARGDTVVSISGIPRSGSLDSLLVIDTGREFSAFFSARSATPLGDVEPQVLEKVLQAATDIAREGREGRPVGTTFILGDYQKVLPLCRQMVINPFRGYRDEEKNVLDPSMGETLKEFSTIDGAFILRGDGVIMSAGTFLRPERSAVNLPSGLGARHAAAAALTAMTAAIAVVVSQSTGSVSLFKSGKLAIQLEKPKA